MEAVSRSWWSKVNLHMKKMIINTHLDLLVEWGHHHKTGNLIVR